LKLRSDPLPGPFDPVLKEATARSNSIRKETKSAAVKLYDSLVIAFGERDIPEEYTPSSIESGDRRMPEKSDLNNDRLDSLIVEKAAEKTDHLSPSGAEEIQANQRPGPPSSPEIPQKAKSEPTSTKTLENVKSKDVWSSSAGIRGSTPVIQIKDDERYVGRNSAIGSVDKKSKDVTDNSAVDKTSTKAKSESEEKLKTSTDSNRANELTPDTNFAEAQESIASALSAEISIEQITTDESAPRELEEHEVFFPSNSFLFAKGDKADFFYVIVSGKIQLIEPRGATLIATLEPPVSFGEQAILAGGIRSLSAQAVEPTICKAYSVDTLGKLLDRAKGTNKPVIYALLLELYMRNDIKSHQASGN
jgi:hypothetical protein